MALLKYKFTSPPGGFVYRQAETALTITGDSLADLTRRVCEHRRYKGLKPDDDATVSLEVQRQICTRLGLAECKAEPGDDWVPLPNTRRFTLMDFLAFSRTMFEHIKNGGKLVPMEEVDRRHKICANCPLNQPTTGCKCGLFYKMVNTCIPAERRFEDLHVCGVCHCSNSAKINIPMEVLRAGGDQHTYPVHCYLHQKVSPPAK